MGRDTLINTLRGIYDRPKALQSNFSRDNAHWVGRLASLGLITTSINGSFGNYWRITYKGLRVLDYGDDE